MVFVVGFPTFSQVAEPVHPAIRDPSGENAIALIEPLDSKAAVGCPVLAFHNRTIPSRPPLASSEPSGEKTR
jgi:hypothetical protein